MWTPTPLDRFEIFINQYYAISLHHPSPHIDVLTPVPEL